MKIIFGAFDNFSLLNQSVKAYIADDDKSFYVKEALYPSYRKHQKLFSYHIYSCIKFEQIQKLHDFLPF